MTTTLPATLIDPIRARAASAPEWPGIVLLLEDGTRQIVTAAELWAETVAAASGLRRAGVHPDDVILLVMGHSRPMITAFLGAIALGAVPSLVSTPTPRVDLALYRKRIEALVRAAAAKAVVVHSADTVPLRDVLSGGFARQSSTTGAQAIPSPAQRGRPVPSEVEGAREGAAGGRNVGDFCGPLPYLPPPRGGGDRSRSGYDVELPGDALSGIACRVIASDVLEGEPDESALYPASPERIAFIQFSSGSGGMQKGIVHTHAAVRRYIEYKRRDHRLTPDDVIVNWTPLYHDQGLVSGLLAPLVIGFRTVLMSPLQWVRQPGLLLQAMHEYGGTLCYMPNFALNHCVRAMRERDSQGLDLSRWRLLLLGGEPVRVESLRAFAERFGPQGFRETAFRAGYGMAEMVEGVTASRQGPPRVDWIDVAALQRHGRAEPAVPQAPGSTAFVSCGPPKEGAELRIVDAAATPLPERRVGEIEVRTESMMREYHRRPDLTRAAFRDGWFRSGDLGYLAGGELHVVGRQKDLIIVGGHNIAPDEIEAVAERVPGVLPGRVVAFGVPDARAGTDRVILVCEAVQPEDVEQRIALERDLRRATVQALDLTLGEVRLVERGWIIKTSSGKKARGDNREKYLAQFGTAPQASES